MIDITKIKLVIWDLDDTFWKGTLSEGPIEIIDNNVQLVKELVDKGVMCSICSKNDFDKARLELEKIGTWNSFVFPSIDWTAKAPRIESIIKTMALRPVNVLFIDDNEINLKEANFYLPDLNVISASDIPLLSSGLYKITKNDLEHSRLKQYRVLEQKTDEKNKIGSTEAFLLQSGIHVDIDYDCLNYCDRIEEMVVRTNQLNYTKLRSSKEEIKNILNREEYKCGVVNVNDKYGNYGTVGFFALNESNKTLLHFLFSCRTLGMGIEQWVYEYLNFPKLTIVGDVANGVEAVKKVNWINVADTSQEKKYKVDETSCASSNVSVLLKSPCDLETIIPYLGNKNNIEVVTEFNYMDERGVAISAHNDSVHVVNSLMLSKDDIDELLGDAPFLNRGAFETKLFRKHWDIVFYSLLNDGHEGLYIHKRTGHKICFSSANFDLTNPLNWDKFLSGEYQNHEFKFTREILENFSRNFEFRGYPSVDEIESDLTIILDNLPKDTHVVFMLGSEIEYENNQLPAFDAHAANHRQINEREKKTFADRKNVEFIEYTDYIKSQKSFNDCVNHFSRDVYYALSQRIVYIINSHSKGNERIEIKNGFQLFFGECVSLFYKFKHQIGVWIGVRH